MFEFGNILNVIGAMRWLDLFDILLVSLIVYKIIGLLQGTRSGQVVLGLAILFIAYNLSIKFEFLTLHFILSAFISQLIIVVVILFSADIRRGLSRIAIFSFSRSSPEALQAVNEVVRASFFMAEKRTGALIAFERKVGLGEYVEVGAQLSAVVSDRLLLSIFNAEAPLHDGAVIIQGGTLAAAGCFLPLTPAEEQVSRFFGTRHRAAIGLSRETDALVVIVSEERGSVSLAKDGQVSLMMSAANLRDRLIKHLGLEKTK